MPVVNTLWSAVNATRLRDRLWKDDDDMIGVSARVYPNLGLLFAQPTIVPPTLGPLMPGSTQSTTLLFSGDGARWFMTQANLSGRWV